MNAIDIGMIEVAIRSRTDCSDATARVLAERVARGAEWLDVRWPTWEYSVDLDKLDMTGHCDCVLGQMIGDYRGVDNEEWDGYFGDRTNPRFTEHLGIRKIAEDHGLLLTRDEAIGHGFHTQHPHDYDRDVSQEWVGLTEGWRHLIESRVQADPAPF